MASKNKFSIFLLLCLASASFAGTITESFTYAPNQWVRYITADIKADPSFTTGSTYYCTGAQINPASISSAWYISTYDTLLSNSATQESCPIPYTVVNTNQPLTWVSASQYTSMTTTNPYFPSPTSFQNYMSGIGVSSLLSDEKSRLMNPSGGVTVINGNSYFKAASRVYCKSTASVASSNPAYNQGPVAYIGQSPIFTTPITLNQVGTFTFTTTVSLDGCLAAATTYLNSPCASTAYFYKNLSASPATFTSATKTIIVKNPFSCNLQALSFSPLSMNNSTTTSFSLVIKNNGDSVNITSITLAAGSQFSNLVIGAPTLPYTLNGAGTQATFSGTIKAPATPNIYTLTLNIASVSTTPNCTGSTANCNLQASFTINVTAGGSGQQLPTSCTLAFDNHASTFSAPDSAFANATCRASNNAIVPCGILSWTTTATGGAMNPAATSTPPQASRSQLSFTTVNAYQNNAIVKAQQGTNFSCQILLNQTGPDYTSTILVPANNSQYQVNTVFSASVQTKNIGAATGTPTFTRVIFNNGAPVNYNIPGLGQQAAVTSNPSFTCPSAPGTYKLNSSADATSVLTELNENNNNDEVWINCTLNAPGQVPDYTSSISAPATVPLNTAFQVNVTTTNIGNGAASANSTTYVRIAGIAVSFKVRPLLANGEFVVNTTTYTCPGTDSYIQINSSADYFNQVGEVNRMNNNDTFTVHCAPQGPTLLPNYIPIINAPSIAFVGVGFIANFTTKNVGTANATNNSTTRATFQTTVKDFYPIFPLAVQQQQMNWWDFSCTSAGTKNLVETVNIHLNVTESTTADNVQVWPISCSNVPTSCNLSFAGPNYPPFQTFANSMVAATCYNGNSVTACPPFYWQQTANNSSMSPVYTNASWSSNSTLTITNADTPQIGRKVIATSTLSGVPLACELPFDISNSAVGPDYTVTSISPAPQPATYGQTIHFTVRVTNIGNVDAVNNSNSIATYSAGCTPVTS